MPAPPTCLADPRASQVFLNLVLEYVPETVYRIGKHYSKAGQRMPTLFVKLYVWQVGPQPTPDADCATCSAAASPQHAWPLLALPARL